MRPESGMFTSLVTGSEVKFLVIDEPGSPLRVSNKGALVSERAGVVTVVLSAGTRDELTDGSDFARSVVPELLASKVLDEKALGLSCELC